MCKCIICSIWQSNARLENLKKVTKLNKKGTSLSSLDEEILKLYEPKDAVGSVVLDDGKPYGKNDIQGHNRTYFLCSVHIFMSTKELMHIIFEDEY